MPLAAAALLLAIADLPPHAFEEPEITAGRRVRRVVITKTGWRSGQQALILEGKRAEELYARMAGNRRVYWTCGHHWAFRFEYRDGKPETIALNEHCETFQRDGAELSRQLGRLYKEAKEKPSHYFIHVTRDRKRQTLWSTRPWTRARIEELRKTWDKVEPVEEMDLGN